MGVRESGGDEVGGREQRVEVGVGSVGKVVHIRDLLGI